MIFWILNLDMTISHKNLKVYQTAEFDRLYECFNNYIFDFNFLCKYHLSDPQ